VRKQLIPGLAVAVTAAALITAATAIPAWAVRMSNIYNGYGFGSGSTSTAAYNAAFTNLNAVNFDCLWGTIVVIYDTQQSSGIWNAEITAKCVTPNNN